MASRWRSIPKIDVHAHVILHQRENTDLILNRPKQMLEMMGKHNVKQAVVLPISFPQYFPLSPKDQQDWLRANNEIQSRLMPNPKVDSLPSLIAELMENMRLQSVFAKN